MNFIGKWVIRGTLLLLFSWSFFELIGRSTLHNLSALHGQCTLEDFSIEKAPIENHFLIGSPQGPPHFILSPGKEHVLVTGGAGFIGSHAALRLLEEGNQVTIVDNLSRGNYGAILELERMARPGQLRFVLIDLGNKDEVMDLFRVSNFDAVIHFAGLAYVAESILQPLLYYANNTENTLILLQAMQSNKVEKLVFSSSCATYGVPESFPVVESTPQNPLSPYGASKLASEKMIIEFSKFSQLQVAILRYFNVVGSDPRGRLGEDPNPEISKIYGRISGACYETALGLRSELSIFGTDYETPDGTTERDYIHVTDLIDAHVKVLQSLTKPGLRIYNVGTGKGYSTLEFVRACRNVTGAALKVKSKPRRPNEPASLYSDPSKIKQELKWEPRFVELSDMLATGWNWRLQHPNGYGIPPPVDPPHLLLKTTSAPYRALSEAKGNEKQCSPIQEDSGKVNDAPRKQMSLNDEFQASKSVPPPKTHISNEAVNVLQAVADAGSPSPALDAKPVRHADQGGDIDRGNLLPDIIAGDRLAPDDQGLPKKGQSQSNSNATSSSKKGSGILISSTEVSCDGRTGRGIVIPAIHRKSGGTSAVSKLLIAALKFAMEASKFIPSDKVTDVSLALFTNRKHFNFLSSAERCTGGEECKFWQDNFPKHITKVVFIEDFEEEELIDREGKFRDNPRHWLGKIMAAQHSPFAYTMVVDPSSYRPCPDFYKLLYSVGPDTFQLAQMVAAPPFGGSLGVAKAFNEQLPSEYEQFPERDTRVQVFYTCSASLQTFLSSYRALYVKQVNDISVAIANSQPAMRESIFLAKDDVHELQIPPCSRKTECQNNCLTFVEQ